MGKQNKVIDDVGMDEGPLRWMVFNTLHGSRATDQLVSSTNSVNDMA